MFSGCCLVLLWVVESCVLVVVLFLFKCVMCSVLWFLWLMVNCIFLVVVCRWVLWKWLYSSVVILVRFVLGVWFFVMFLVWWCYRKFSVGLLCSLMVCMVRCLMLVLLLIGLDSSSLLNCLFVSVRWMRCRKCLWVGVVVVGGGVMRWVNIGYDCFCCWLVIGVWGCLVCLVVLVLVVDEV